MRQFSNKTFKQFHSGFTLIEILVTIAIVGLLLIVSVPAFRNYKYKNDLARGADMVQSAIYEAKNLALAPQVEKSDDVGYYVIKFTPASEGNEFYIYEAEDENTPYSSGNLVKKFDLPTGVKFDNTLLPEGIVFSIKDQAKIVKPKDDAYIKIYHEKIKSGDKNADRTIIVNHITGQVSIE